jgi:Protein of unknown function (DUF1501)
VRERYGADGAKYIYGNDPKPTVHWPAEKFLLARRLVEAGVSVVTMRVSPWDYHGKGSGTGNIFTGLRSLLPLLDRSLYALVTDIHERGLEKEVLVLVWGEFGRTPKVNKDEGRDHWPECGFALFAGGGLKTGQVVGRTDGKAERPKDRALSALQIALVIILGPVKRHGRRDLRHDGPMETAAVLLFVARSRRRRLLFRRVVVDGGAILSAVIRSLTIERCRIVIGPKNI